MNILKKEQETQTKQNNGWAVVKPELKPYTPEWFLANYMENWTNDDVRVAIANDVRPDLSTYASLILDQTTDFFMNFLKTQRPDLKNIQTKEGKAWIRKIVKSATGFV